MPSERHRPAGAARMGDGAFRLERSERRQHHVHELHRRRDVRARGSRGAGIDHRPGFGDNANDVTRAIGIAQVGIDQPDERIEAAGFNQSAAQVDRSPALRVTSRKVDRQFAALHGRTRMQPHRAVAIDTIAVKKTLGLVRPFWKASESIAEFARRGSDRTFDRRHEDRSAKVRAQSGHTLACQTQHADLAIEVTEQQAWLPGIGADQPKEIVVAAAGAVELHRRQQHALLEHLGSLAIRAARDDAADIGLVRDAAGEGDKFAAMKDRSHHGEIRGVRQVTLIGMIAEHHIAVFQYSVVDLQNPVDQMEINRRVQGHWRRHRDASRAIGDDTGEIAQFADDGRIAGAEEMVVHLLHQNSRSDYAEVEPSRRRLTQPSRASRIRLRWPSTSAVHPGGSSVVASSCRTMAGPATA